MRKLLILGLFAVAVSSIWPTIIPSDRLVTWQGNAGVLSGGIPNRTTIFVNVLTTTNASYKCAGDGVTDDSTPLKNAITACPVGQVVYCPTANYLISNKIAVARNDFVLRGDGPGLTVFLANTTGNAFEFNLGDYYPPSSRTVGISSGYTKGSTSVTLATTPTSLAVGCLLIIDQLNDETNVTAHGNQGLCTWTDRPHNGTRNRAQMVQVTSVSGTAVTFSPSLNNDYDSSLTPQATTYPATKFQTYLGFENFTIKNINAAGGDLLQIEWAYQSWVRNVEFDNVVGHDLFLDHTLQCEFRHCYFHDAMSYTVGNGYGLTSLNSWNCLYEDNIFYHLYNSLTVEGSGACVVGYNYVSHTYNGPNPAYMIVGISAHSAQESMMLYEGNVANEFQADFTWGSSDHLTFLRNYFSGNDDGITSNRKCISLDNHSLSDNVVGNVLGDSGVTWTAYSMPQTSGYAPTNSVIYRFGFPSIGNNTFTSASSAPGSNDLDTRVAPSTIVHGNYDQYNHAVVWDPTISDHTIPNSLFYSSQPSWWTGAPWPPIGSDLTPTVSSIPAQIRFNAGTPTPTPTPTASPTPTATPTPTPTPTASPIDTPTPTVTPTPTATPTVTPTVTPTATATPSPISPTVPYAPTGLVVIVPLTLRWNLEPSEQGVTKYSIYRVKGNAGELVGTTTPPTVIFSVASFLNAKNTKFYVTATNVNGESPKSGTVSVRR